MIGVARLSDGDRHDLFRNTADRMGMSDAIVEKDFWVCYVLDYLFHRSPWPNAFSFKGGTSLSKAYHLIKRFSEDIDLILDWRVLGYGRNEPWLERSKTRQEAFNNEVNSRAERFLSDQFCPKMKSGLSDELGKEVVMHVDGQDGQTVIFAYPALFANPVTLPMIRLEIGALAAWTPARQVLITSYAAEQYPKLFAQESSSIQTVAPERTFWEKATILHHEANRPENLVMPPRYARHYYDLYQMIESKEKEEALMQIDLLQRVVEFKTKFYPRGWARYADAKPGTLKLVPPDYRFTALKADYASMRDMLFGDVPSFETVMEAILLLEREINE